MAAETDARAKDKGMPPRVSMTLQKEISEVWHRVSPPGQAPFLTFLQKFDRRTPQSALARKNEKRDEHAAESGARLREASLKRLNSEHEEQRKQ
jgi:hypothetical protein